MAEFTSNSKNVQHVEFEDGTLVVLFTSGRKYRYTDVPEEVYAALYGAEVSGGSVGRTFNDLVRNGGFDTEEITGS